MWLGWICDWNEVVGRWCFRELLGRAVVREADVGRLGHNGAWVTRLLAVASGYERKVQQLVFNGWKRWFSMVIGRRLGCDWSSVMEEEA
ncbi:hypothetical protein Peur_048029 [Populus x canadensis]